ncbi:MAG: glycosyltransferase family 2 protein [Acidiferrobacteraceae bacterium]
MFDPPILITCRDRVRDLRALVAWLEAAGHQDITLVDNASTWPPLLDYLAQSPHRVVRSSRNLGKTAIWQLGLAPTDGWFVHTDPDVVPHENCPSTLIRRLRGLLLRHDGWPAAGPGLYLEDVPASMTSLQWERGPVINGRELEPGARASLIDTTMALYRPGFDPSRHGLPCQAIRTEHPYVARHGSWYVTAPDDEDRYYLAHAEAGAHASSWAAGHQRTFAA